MRSYAALLHDDLREHDKAEALYKRILAGSPAAETKARVLCDYARLLQVQQKSPANSLRVLITAKVPCERALQVQQKSPANTSLARAPC